MRPTWSEFQSLSKTYNMIPLVMELSGDMETPVTVLGRIADKKSFLFESVEGGEKIGRYTFLGSTPSKVYRFTSRQNPFQKME